MAEQSRLDIRSALLAVASWSRLLYEMKRRQARKGLAALCIGGGMGAALAVESIEMNY